MKIVEEIEVSAVSRNSLFNLIHDASGRRILLVKPFAIEMESLSMSDKNNSTVGLNAWRSGLTGRAVM